MEAVLGDKFKVQLKKKHSLKIYIHISKIVLNVPFEQIETFVYSKSTNDCKINKCVYINVFYPFLFARKCLSVFI